MPERAPEFPGIPIEREVRLHSFAKLSNPAYLRRLKAAAASLDYPRRHWRRALIEWLEEFEGAMFGENGARLRHLPDVDVILGDDDDGKWAGEFAMPCPPGKRPRLQRRVWKRAQLIDGYIRDQFPELLP